MNELDQLLQEEGNQGRTWPVMRNGEPNATEIRNLRHLLYNIEKLKFRFNELKSVVEICREDERASEICDYDLQELYVRSSEEGLRASKEKILDVITADARKDSYDPFLEFILSEEHDGTSRINDLFNCFEINYSEDSELTKEQQEDFYRKALTKFMLGVMYKSFSPKAEQNFMLVLNGAQGIGKSRFLHKLSCADIITSIFKEGIDLGQKDTQFDLLDHRFLLVDEVDRILGVRESGQIKSVITQAEVNARPAYGRLNRKGIARASFIGATNVKEFLNDPTGSRRFLVLPVEKIDPTNIQSKSFRQQLWREIYNLYRAGAKHWLDFEDQKTINKLNGEFQIDSPVDGLISHLVKPIFEEDPKAYWLSIDEILDASEIEHITRNLQNQRNHPAFRSKFGQTMSRQGFESTRKKVKGIKITKYFVKFSEAEKAKPRMLFSEGAPNV